MEKGGWSEPAGFHLIVLPFADDIRAPPLDEEFRGTMDLFHFSLAFIPRVLCIIKPRRLPKRQRKNG